MKSGSRVYLSVLNVGPHLRAIEVSQRPPHVRLFAHIHSKFKRTHPPYQTPHGTVANAISFSNDLHFIAIPE